MERPRTLRRFAWAFIISCIGLVAIRIGWGTYAAHVLQKTLDEGVAAGERLYPDDFNPDPLPAELNGAMVLDEAAAQMDLTALLNSRVDQHLDYTEADHAVVAQALADSAGALELVRSAAQLENAAWPPFKSPLVTMPLPHLMPQRTLQRLLTLKTYDCVRLGDHYNALATVSEALRASAHLDRQPLLISHLVSTAVDDMHLATLERVLPELQLRSDSQRRGVTQRQLRSLVDQLRNEDNYHLGLSEAFAAEQMFFVDTTRLLREGGVSMGGGPQTFGERVSTALMRPAIELSAAAAIREFRVICPKLKSKNYPTVRASIPDLETGVTDKGLLQLINSYVLMFMPAFDRATSAHYQALARRRAAAVAVALRAFELERDVRATALDELVPEFIDAIPVDPFSADGLPLLYRREGRGAVYSVGMDGLDDQGSIHRVNAGPVFMDVVFFLDSLPVLDSNEQAADNQNDVEGGGG
jgi:hypothetical protein